MAPDLHSTSAPAASQTQKMAEEIIRQMESLVVHQLPKMAESWSENLHKMEQQLHGAEAMIRSLTSERTQLEADNERLHKLQADTEARVRDLEQARASLEEDYNAKLAQVEDLTRRLADLEDAKADLERAHGTDLERIEAMARDMGNLQKEHEDATMRIQAVEQFMKAFPRV